MISGVMAIVAAREDTTSDMMGRFITTMENKDFCRIPAILRLADGSGSFPNHEPDLNKELCTINSIPATAAKESWKLGVKMDRG